VIAAAICLAVGSGRPAPLAPAGLVALVEPWAVDSPIVGLRCSGVIVGANEVLTAAHCLAGDPLLVVTTGSLCEQDRFASALVDAGTEATTRSAPGRTDSARVSVDATLERIQGMAPEPAVGPVLVVGFGVRSDLGRPACDARTYEGRLIRCASSVPGADWCIEPAPGAQLCEGSSGAPVFVRHGAGWAVVGVISGGPPCGADGPAVVAVP
jgi:hypothetical protein